MDTKIDPHTPRCGLCQGDKIPLVKSGVRICPHCDGWPPILEPPTVGRTT